jgi:3-carboxy-cis,cis-muconate cycloisomerase
VILFHRQCKIGAQKDYEEIPVRLIESLATTAQLSEIFSDASILGAMLDFEIALARAEAELKIIPEDVAEIIATAATVESFDPSALAEEAIHSGTPAIAFVKQLTACVRAKDPVAAGYVHWGTTSQDLCDTAFMLLLQRARQIIHKDVQRLGKALTHLAEEHKSTVMLGRTLMQAAPPITFGLKAAGWAATVSRSHQRMETSFEKALVLQFGGASGTLAALGEHGLPVAEKLAKLLQLTLPDAPWHTHRDRLAELVCACGVLTGSLGKIARDISLLMQNEIAEVAEPSVAGRGGSSTLPHKHNPVGCTVTLSVANRMPGLVSSFLSAMVQEHERAAGGWQAEWAIISAVIQSTGLAIASMAEVAEGLTVDASRMRANIESTRGVIFAERAMILLGAKLGRDKAHRLLEEATRKSAAEGRHLRDVLKDMQSVTGELAAQLKDLEDPNLYLGSAEQFRNRLLASAKQKRNSGDNV